MCFLQVAHFLQAPLQPWAQRFWAHTTPHLLGLSFDASIQLDIDNIQVTLPADAVEILQKLPSHAADAVCSWHPAICAIDSPAGSTLDSLRSWPADRHAAVDVNISLREALAQLPHSDSQDDADVYARLAAAVLQRFSYSSSAGRTLCLNLQQDAGCAARVQAALPLVYGINHVCLFLELSERQVTAALWDDTQAIESIESMLWALHSAPSLAAATFSLHLDLHGCAACKERTALHADGAQRYSAYYPRPLGERPLRTHGTSTILQQPLQASSHSCAAREATPQLDLYLLMRVYQALGNKLTALALTAQFNVALQSAEVRDAGELAAATSKLVNVQSLALCASNAPDALIEPLTWLPQLQTMQVCAQDVAHMAHSLPQLQHLTALALSDGCDDSLAQAVPELASLRQLELTAELSMLCHLLVPGGLKRLRNLRKLCIGWRNEWRDALLHPDSGLGGLQVLKLRTSASQDVSKVDMAAMAQAVACLSGLTRIELPCYSSACLSKQWCSQAASALGLAPALAPQPQAFFALDDGEHFVLPQPLWGEGGVAQAERTKAVRVHSMAVLLSGLQQLANLHEVHFAEHQLMEEELAVLQQGVQERPGVRLEASPGEKRIRFSAVDLLQHHLAPLFPVWA